MQVSSNEARFDVIVAWEPGCYRVEITRTADGWGREVAPQRVQVFPAPEPRPESTYKVQLKIENKMSDELWALLTGERAS
ncbi:hypothetical protein D8M34_06060 [Microbacterium sp. HSID17254]|nr:hypothetical protein D8M34_06060 [Microbacterium sp. HSID17254]